MTDFAKLVLEADTKQLEKASKVLDDLDRNAKETASGVDASNEKMNKSFSTLAKVGIGAVAGLAVGAGAALVKMTKDAIDTADMMDEVAQKIGIGVEELSRLKYAAEISGVTFENLQTSVAKLSRGMVDAMQGTGQAKAAFDALGISVTGADGQLRSATDVMGDVADRFAGMNDGAQKTALAMDIFGRSGRDMILMLNGGKDALKELTSEADRFGVVIDEETGRKAGLFNENLDRMRFMFSGIGTRIAAEALPRLVQFSNWLVDNQDKIVRVTSAVLNFGIAVVDTFSRAVIWVSTFSERMNKAIPLLGKLDEWTGLAPRRSDAGDPLSNALETVRGAMSRAQNAATATRTAFASMGAAAVNAGTIGGAAISAGISEATQRATRQAEELQRLMDRLFPKEAAARQFGSDMTLLGGNDAARRALANQYDIANDNEKPSFESIFGNGVGGSIAEQSKDFERELERLATNANTQTVRIAKSFGDMATDTLSALDRMTQAIKGGGFLDILSSVIGLGLQLGSIGAFGSSVANNINKVPARALGGNVGAGQSYLVGERGPEMFTPATAGRIAANNNGGGGETRVVVEASPYFDVRVNQNIGAAAPSIAAAGAQGGASQMAFKQSRRWR